MDQRSALVKPAPIGWDDQQFADTMENTADEMAAFLSGKLPWSPLRQAGADAHAAVMAAVAKADQGGANDG